MATPLLGTQDIGQFSGGAHATALTIPPGTSGIVLSWVTNINTDAVSACAIGGVGFTDIGYALNSNQSAAGFWGKEDVSARADDTLDWTCSQPVSAMVYYFSYAAFGTFASAACVTCSNSLNGPTIAIPAGSAAGDALVLTAQATYQYAGSLRPTPEGVQTKSYDWSGNRHARHSYAYVTTAKQHGTYWSGFNLYAVAVAFPVYETIENMDFVLTPQVVDVSTPGMTIAGFDDLDFQLLPQVVEVSTPGMVFKLSPKRRLLMAGYADQPEGPELLDDEDALSVPYLGRMSNRPVWKEMPAGVTDHGALTGLADDDHTQYIKDSEFGAKGDILVGTGAGTFVPLTVGTDGEAIIADSAEASGLNFGPAGSSLTVEEADAVPSVTSVDTIVVGSKFSVTDDTGGQVTIDSAGYWEPVVYDGEIVTLDGDIVMLWVAE